MTALSQRHFLHPPIFRPASAPHPAPRTAAPRERFLRYLPKLDRLAVVERNTFRLLDPSTLRERVVRSGGGGPVVCANEIVALEHCRLGTASDRELLAVATQRHLLLYQV